MYSGSQLGISRHFLLLAPQYRTEQGHCGACRRKWRLTDTDLCPCGEIQTVFLPHCRILSPDKTEWQLISATLCGWRHCFVADQLWFMTHIREEEEWAYIAQVLVYLPSRTKWHGRRELKTVLFRSSFGNRDCTAQYNCCLPANTDCQRFCRFCLLFFLILYGAPVIASPESVHSYLLTYLFVWHILFLLHISVIQIRKLRTKNCSTITWWGMYTTALCTLRPNKLWSQGTHALLLLYVQCYDD